jgi:hypothetical protein
MISGQRDGDHADEAAGGGGEAADGSEAAAEGVVRQAAARLAAEREQVGQGRDGHARVGGKRLQADWSGAHPAGRRRSKAGKKDKLTNLGRIF